MMRLFLVAALLFAGSVHMQPIHAAPAARSQVSLTYFGYSQEFPLLNLFKDANPWSRNDNSPMYPEELDSNGWPLPGAAWTAHGGAKVLVYTPSQTDRPGHYVLLWTGTGHSIIGFNGSGETRLVSCGGGAGSAFGSGVQCDNTPCSTFTGQIDGTTLTVTAPPKGRGCGLRQGVPITGDGVALSKFGTPTVITSAGSPCGANTCYTVNQPQRVAGATMQAGVRLEWAVTKPFQTIQDDIYGFSLVATGNAPNYAQNFALFHVDDEPAYWNSAKPCPDSYGQGCITSGIFQTRIKQANFGVMRDLDYIGGNTTNCSTWSTRRPINYYSYGANDEYRNARDGQGQYATSSGGAGGATVRYDAAANNYDIRLGTGNFQDKQTILWLPPVTGNSSSTVSLNGSPPVPVFTSYGAAKVGPVPTAGVVLASVYEATLGGLLSSNSNGAGAGAGLECPVPPEVFVEMNAELKTTPWHVVPFLAMDPMTDWVKQYAAYLKANYPQAKPIFEVTNEPNNFVTPAACYLSEKSRAYAARDPAWKISGGIYCGAPSNIAAEVGKMASTVGQDLVSVLGPDGYEELAPMDPIGNSSSVQNALMFTSTPYVNQTSIPVQPGYTQTPAYNYLTRFSIANYWNLSVQWPEIQGRGIETALAYCYYNFSRSASCQSSFASQAAVMTQYFSYAVGTIVPQAGGNITSTINYHKQFMTAATTCFTGTTRPSTCTLNRSSPAMMYEGGFAPNSLAKNMPGMTDGSGDVVEAIRSATNASQAVLTTPNPDGCVPGMTINLSALSGGAWSSAAGNYQVQSATTNTCTINLDSTALGTLRSATITYTGSSTWVQHFRNMSYTAPDLDPWTTRLYADLMGTGPEPQTPPVTSPSQYLLGSQGLGFLNNSPWTVFATDIYGYYPAATCTSCKISGSTLTLGGTIVGIFQSGQTLIGGGGITGVATGAGSNTMITSTCTPIGANVCGTTAGDTLSLSQPSNVSSQQMIGTIAPSPNQAGTGTTSPVRAWGAICRFNGNGSQCNG